MKTITLSLCAFFFCENISAQLITRGPYLQMGTPSGMTIRWRTDSLVIGKVNFGNELSNLLNSIEESAATTEHIITITGLSSNTIYYYNVGTPAKILLDENEDIYFKTSPMPGTRQPIRAWVIGDFGNASPEQVAVMNSYLNFTGSTPTDVWLWTGDNAYGDGTQLEYQLKVFNIYIAPFRKIVAWPTPGNHDYGSVNILNEGPYYDIFALPTNGEAGGIPSDEEGYYSYDYGNAHFISLNSEYLTWVWTNDTEMTDWLRDDLENNTKDWVIAYWHQPPYTKGSHDSDDAFGRMGMMRQNINPILEEYDVDLVLTGHSHGYERSYMIKGHYGTSNTFDRSAMIVDSVQPFTKYVDGPDVNKGTVYAVVGCSGQLSSSGTMDHPVYQFSTNAYHGSLVIDIDGLTLTAKFLTANDGIKDSFTIQKMSVADTVSGIGNTVQFGKMSVMPNPVRDMFKVEFDMNEISDANLSLVNVAGEQVAELFKGNLSRGQMTFSTGDFPSGIYFIRLSAGGYLETVKFVLSR